MKNISLNISNALGFTASKSIENYAAEVKNANEKLHNGTGKGNDFLGWIDLPSSISAAFLNEIQETAKLLREQCEVVVVAGIGGSYLGSKAVVEALSNSFANLAGDRKNPAIVFAGNNISEDYLAELSDLLKNKQFGIINISKSGTTTETALAFRLLKTQLEEQAGKAAAKQRIVAITDASKGALRKLADIEGYKTFVIPDNVGGRFSVLTPVGLLPIAVAGFDIKQLVAGAVVMEKQTMPNIPFAENISGVYAAIRNELYQKTGKKIEILVNYHPKMHFIS
ncbi:MAG: glucose-6-phosphate isomerase, partial [Prevotellaceae bacterium]|nr:glucose-6-phosphate isomerase [Prevotellaceae bacterium]